MSQQVNLFEIGLVRSKEWFTLWFVLGVYVIAALVMLYVYSGIRSENSLLMDERKRALAQYETTQKKVDEFAQRAQPVDQSNFENTLKTLKARFEMQSQILTIFQQSLSEESAQLIDYMRALTGQQQPGLWLTGFKLEPSYQHVTLSGQSLKSDDVPAYLDLLSRQKVFAGTHFSGIEFKQLELKKNTSDSVAVNAAVAPPAETPATLPAGKASAEPEKILHDQALAEGTPVTAAAGHPVTSQPASLKVYAFEVKGQELRDQALQQNMMTWSAFVRSTVQGNKVQP